MGSKLERLKQLNEQSGRTQKADMGIPITATAQNDPTKFVGSLPEPVHPAKEIITHTCGHKVGVANLEEIACPACRQRNRSERNLRRRTTRQAKEQPAADVSQGRLPDGSAFVALYDATAMCWAGSLTITTVDPPKVFAAEASAVFKVLTALDAQYRRWLAEETEGAGDA